MKRLLFITLSLLLLAAPVFGATKTVTVAWDKTPIETDLSGFTLFQYNAAGTLQSQKDVPYTAGMTFTTTHTVTIPDAASTQICYDMDAYDLSGNHSAKSSPKACITIDLLAPGAPTNLRVNITVP